MRPLVKLYLALGIATQFMVAGAIYFGCLLFAQCYRVADIKLPDLTLCILSTGHWAFVWPVAMLLLTVLVLYKARTEKILLHLFGGMMLAAIVIIIIVFLGFAVPFTLILSA